MKTISINKSIVTLLVGVLLIVMAISGCESNIPTQHVEEIATLEDNTASLEEQSQTSEGSLLKDIIRDLEPGIISKSYFTETMRKLLEENGIDPEQVRSSNDIPENIKLLRGEEALIEFSSEWEQNDKSAEKSFSPMFDPEISSEYPVFFLSQSAVPATTEFVISETGSSPTNGSVTVNYQGIQITTNYTSTWNAIAVANTISHNINTHSSIQLSASVSGTTVKVTEKRDGCSYNGNLVSVSHTNGTHITVNNDSFYMKDGHDGEGWCPPPPPPPSTVSLDWGSFINTNSISGAIQMGSYTWASVNLYYLSVASHSYNDGFLILDQFDECYNCNQVAAGLVTSKNPAAPSEYWQQYGQHIWWFHPDDNVLLYTISYKWTNF
ncbi:MAG: hypothetical protein WDZ38_06885 [Balneolaceae bacterium]